MKKFVLAVFTTALILSGGPYLYADDTELFTIRVSPDALIMLDLSGHGLPEDWGTQHD
jgi:hypothetical protein